MSSRHGDRPEQVQRRSQESRTAHGSHCQCAGCAPKPMPGRR